MSTGTKDTNGTAEKKQEVADQLLAGLDALINNHVQPEATTAPAIPATPNGLMFATLPPRAIDLDVVEKFLDKVFHAGLEDGENILTWIVSPRGNPAYPKSENDFFDMMEKTKHQKALYYGTATFTPSPDDGKLYNQQKLFKSLRVVVLDDIGTKVPMGLIPKAFKPSYILESSEGNFQYGYILTEPVTDLAASTALIELIYESEFSDEGGKMPNKIVRLPEGVNGKKGVKEGFVSNLHELNNRTYTPQEIINALHLSADWDTIVEDAAEATKRRASRNTGSTPWSSIQPQAAALNGFVDPVLEWLYAEDLVTIDNGAQFVDIKCPWSEGHSDGQLTAGYIPLGRGDSPNMRVFHCFHDSCASNKTPEFLKYIAAAAGIEAAQFDAAAGMTSQYVLNALDGSVYDVKSEVRGRNLKKAGFTTKYSKPMKVYTGEGKEKFIAAYKMWELSPSRVDVSGTVYDPSTPARIVEQQGEKYVNLFYQPKWGDGVIDMTQVDRFNEYLDYLIPDPTMRHYLGQWIAAKVQNMAFRGAAIVMTTHKQGVGRSTLVDMIKTLLGEDNTMDMALSKLIKESEFNEWAAKPFISVEETKTLDGAEFYSSYETLKTLVDPRSKKVTINQKYGLKFSTDMLASFMFLTNHADAIQLPPEDRRFCVMANPSEPAPAAYFMELNKWLTTLDTDGMPLWGRHVYRWLKVQPVDMELLTTPPPRSEAKMAMVAAAKSDINFTIDAIINSWPSPYINANEVIDVLNSQEVMRRVEFDPVRHKKLVARMVNDVSSAYKGVAIKTHGTVRRPRVLDIQYINPDIPTVKKPTTDIESEIARHKLANVYTGRVLDIDAVALTVVDLLNEADR